MSSSEIKDDSLRQPEQEVEVSSDNDIVSNIVRDLWYTFLLCFTLYEAL